MIISGFMEMLSVALIVPFMQFIFDSETILGNKYCAAVMNLFGFKSNGAFLILLSLFMAAIYIGKNFFLVAEYTIQEKFVQNNQFALQQKLLRCFLNRPYEYFLTASTGEIMRVVTSDTSSAFSALTTLITLFSELTVSIILAITAFVIAPQIMVLMSILILLATVIICIFTKKWLEKLVKTIRKPLQLCR